MDYSTYGAQQVNGFSTYGNQVTQEGSGGGEITPATKYRRFPWQQWVKINP